MFGVNFRLIFVTYKICLFFFYALFVSLTSWSTSFMLEIMSRLLIPYLDYFKYWILRCCCSNTCTYAYNIACLSLCRCAYYMFISYSHAYIPKCGYELRISHMNCVRSMLWHVSFPYGVYWARWVVLAAHVFGSIPLESHDYPCCIGLCVRSDIGH